MIFSRKDWQQWFLIVSVVVIVAGCSSPTTSQKALPGSLSLSVVDHVSARTLAPSLSMTPAIYVVTGTNQGDGTTFTATLSPTNPSATVSSITLGSWNIVVQAFNAATGGTLIGTGSSVAQVNASTPAAVTLQVNPLTGTGSLALTLNWPSQVTNPSIVASLTPLLGSAISMPFTISGTQGTYSSSTLPNGYYTMSLSLDENGIAVMGAVDIVRIVSGQVTTGTYNFTNVNSTGTLQIGLVQNVQPSLAVSISGASSTVTQGSSKTLTAGVSNYSGSANMEYVWYINGVAVPGPANNPLITGPTISLSASQAPGYYRIDAIAFAADGSQAGSATASTAILGVPSGRVTTLEGLSAGFVSPNGDVSDGTYLYVADASANVIDKITIATGAVVTLAGSGTAGNANGTGTSASFNGPKRPVTDGTNLYVADWGNNLIRKIVISTGVVTTLAGSGTAGFANGTGTSASFNAPSGLATDGTNLYVADTGNNVIRKIVISTGAVSTFAGTGASGHADGTATTATFAGLNGIGTDGTSLYLSDSSNNIIRQVALSNGQVLTIAGTAGTAGSANGIGTAATFSDPGDVCSDGINLYVADYGNNLIRKIALSNLAVSTLAGSGSATTVDGFGTAASFNGPRCLAILKASTSPAQLFVCQITPDPEIRVIQ